MAAAARAPAGLAYYNMFVIAHSSYTGLLRLVNSNNVHLTAELAYVVNNTTFTLHKNDR